MIYGLMFLSLEPIKIGRPACIAPYIKLLRANKQTYTEILPKLYNTFQLRRRLLLTGIANLEVFLSRLREGCVYPSSQSTAPELCLTSDHWRRFEIRAHSYSSDAFRALLHELKPFQYLEDILVLYREMPGVVDMDVIKIC